MNLKNQPELLKRSLDGSIYHPLKYKYHLRMDGELIKQFYTGKLLNPAQAQRFIQDYAKEMYISPEGFELTRVKSQPRSMSIVHLGVTR